MLGPCWPVFDFLLHFKASVWKTSAKCLKCKCETQALSFPAGCLQEENCCVSLIRLLYLKMDMDVQRNVGAKFLLRLSSLATDHVCRDGGEHTAQCIALLAELPLWQALLSPNLCLTWTKPSLVWDCVMSCVGDGPGHTIQQCQVQGSDWVDSLILSRTVQSCEAVPLVGLVMHKSCGLSGNTLNVAAVALLQPFLAAVEKHPEQQVVSMNPSEGSSATGGSSEHFIHGAPKSAGGGVLVLGRNQLYS